MSYKAEWNGAVIAETNDVVTVEGNLYFPESSLKREYILPSDHSSVCGWKGLANYYSLNVNGQQNANAVWYYKDPKPAADNIRGRVAFWKGVKVSQ